MKRKLKVKLQKVKLFVADFDGVHTDGFAYVDERGVEAVRVSRKDGLGIEALKKAGIEVHVISKERNRVVAARCKKLGVPYRQGVATGEGKAAILEQLLKEKGLSREEFLYMGDDVNDLEALKFAGVAVTVADGHAKAKKVADYVTKRKGGDHAVREVCELVLVAQDKIFF